MLNIKCGLTCERKSDNSVFKFSVTFSALILSSFIRSLTIRKAVLAVNTKRIGNRLNDKKFFRIKERQPIIK